MFRYWERDDSVAVLSTTAIILFVWLLLSMISTDVNLSSSDKTVSHMSVHMVDFDFDGFNNSTVSTGVRVAFITCIFGPFEKSLKSFPKQTIPAHFIAFTDFSTQSTLSANGTVAQSGGNWIFDTHPYHLTHPSPLYDSSYYNSYDNNNHTFNTGKYYKQAFQNIPRLKEYDTIVWLDGTVRINSPFMAEWALNYTLKYGVVAPEHLFQRGSLSKEVKASMSLVKYKGTWWFNQSQPVQHVDSQYKTYIKEGYQDNRRYWATHNKYNNSLSNFGVWITCFVAFNNKHEKIAEFLDLWYLQSLRYTTQDQVSFSYVVQKTGIIPFTIPDERSGVIGTTLDNNMFTKLEHGLRH